MSPTTLHALNEQFRRHPDVQLTVERGDVDQQQFKDIYRAIEKRVPGATLDYEKLLQGDPIECDPLISQGNLALMRLDDLYAELYSAWRNSLGNERISTKRSFSPGSASSDTPGKEKCEHSTRTSLPDARLIDQAVNITLTSFRIQATLTQRREALINAANRPPENKRLAGVDQREPPATCNKPSPPPPRKLQHIAENSIAPIRSIQALSPLRGLGPLPSLRPITSFEPLADDRENNLADAPPQSPASTSPPSPSSALPAPPRETTTKANTANNASLSKKHTSSAPPREPQNQENNEIPEPYLWNGTTVTIADPFAAWPYFIPPGVEHEDDLKRDAWPRYSRPPFPNEKIHQFPPYVPANLEDAAELDAYLCALDPQITADQDVRWGYEYQEAPVWREGHTELEHIVKLNRLRKEKAQALLNPQAPSKPITSSPPPSFAIPAPPRETILQTDTANTVSPANNLSAPPSAPAAPERPRSSPEFLKALEEFRSAFKYTPPPHEPYHPKPRAPPT
jgi:hypothetical protein